MHKIKLFIDSILELVRWFLYHLKEERHPIYIKRMQQDKPIAILGNGDSLLKIANSEIDRTIDYCLVNFSPVSKLFFVIKPKYYILCDQDFFIQPTEAIKTKVHELIESVKQIDWPIFLFVPYVFKQHAYAMFGENTNITFLPFNKTSFTDEFLFKRLEYKLFSKGLASPVLMNVGVAALFCLINAGYKKIYLYGMEHSWIKLIFVDKENNLCVDDRHYYDQDKNNVKILKVGERSQRMHEQLRNQALAFAAYWEIKGYANYIGGVEIVNKTEDSFIDAFKKEY